MTLGEQFQSSKSSYVHRQKQADLHHPQMNLVQDVVTRWTSSYYMIEHIVQQQQPLGAALQELWKTDLMPSDAEMEVFL